MAQLMIGNRCGFILLFTSHFALIEYHDRSFTFRVIAFLPVVWLLLVALTKPITMYAFVRIDALDRDGLFLIFFFFFWRIAFRFLLQNITIKSKINGSTVSTKYYSVQGEFKSCNGVENPVQRGLLNRDPSKCFPLVLLKWVVPYRLPIPSTPT